MGSCGSSSSLSDDTPSSSSFSSFLSPPPPWSSSRSGNGKENAVHDNRSNGTVGWYDETVGVVVGVIIVVSGGDGGMELRMRSPRGFSGVTRRWRRRRTSISGCAVMYRG